MHNTSIPPYSTLVGTEASQTNWLAKQTHQWLAALPSSADFNVITSHCLLLDKPLFRICLNSSSIFMERLCIIVLSFSMLFFKTVKQYWSCFMYHYVRVLLYIYQELIVSFGHVNFGSSQLWSIFTFVPTIFSLLVQCVDIFQLTWEESWESKSRLLLRIYYTLSW